MKQFDKNSESVTRILVTNDDGISSVGLACLVKALSKLPDTEVYVSVPAVQQSGMSHATSLKSHTHVEEVELEGATQAFTVDSTPSDSCLFGLEIFSREVGKKAVNFSAAFVEEVRENFKKEDKEDK